jgi:hypothetical protein
MGKGRERWGENERLVAVVGCLVLGAVGVTGCAPDERMPLADCAHGLYWADCGGNGEPVLGCDRETGACRWFSGGITARGHATSTCPASDLCCHSNWPFTDFSPDGRTREVAVEQLSVLRRGVVSRHENDVAVRFDLTEPTFRQFEVCGPGESGCTAASASSPPFWVGDAFVKQYGFGTERWELEIVPGVTPDEWSVHLYQFFLPMREGLPTPLQCSDSFALGIPHRQLEGTLRLSTDDLSDPASVHGRLEARNEQCTFDFRF